MPQYEALPTDDGAIVVNSDTREEVITVRGDDVYPGRDRTPMANAEFCADAISGRLPTFIEPDKACTPGPWRLTENDAGEFEIEAGSPEGTETIGYIADEKLGMTIVEMMFRVPEHYWDENDTPSP